MTSGTSELQVGDEVEVTGRPYGDSDGFRLSTCPPVGTRLTVRNVIEEGAELSDGFHYPASSFKVVSDTVMHHDDECRPESITQANLEAMRKLQPPLQPGDAVWVRECEELKESLQEILEEGVTSITGSGGISKTVHITVDHSTWTKALALLGGEKGVGR